MKVVKRVEKGRGGAEKKLQYHKKLLDSLEAGLGLKVERGGGKK